VFAIDVPSTPRAVHPSTPRARARRRAAIAFAGVAFGALVTLAPAGVPLVTPDGDVYSWDLDTPAANVVGNKLTYYLDPGGTRDGTTGPLTDLQALRQGIANWELGASRIRFLEDPSRSASQRDGTDRINWIGWVDGGLGPATFAATFPTRDGTRLLDSDVLFNDRDFQWDTRTPGVSGKADIEALMTHEWGHAIGLDHVPLRLSTMYAFSRAGSIRERSLADDDRAVIASVYPNQQVFPQTTGSLSGTVDFSSSSNDRAIHVVAISVFTSEPAGSVLTQPDGSFTLTGLPAGGYRILAAPTLPLGGSMNSFWTSGSTAFLPSFLREEEANPAELQTVSVAAGQTTSVDPMTVALASSPFEPNDFTSNATQIELGDGICARFESGNDVDVYAFSVDQAGQVVSISALAYEIGSDADPILELLDAGGATIASNVDIRSPTLHQTTADGEDLDARLIGVDLDPGNYFVQLRNGSFRGGADHFYGLLVTAASDAPSADLTTVTADPLRIDADGQSVATLTVHPRRQTGADVGPGATVRISHDNPNSVVPSVANDVGDGTYTATVVAPSEPGTDRFSVTIETQFGNDTLMDAVVLVYLGPPDAQTSTIVSKPRRIAADGAAQSVVTFVPRDALGQELGSGRSVAFALDSGPPDASLFGVSDQLDGSYADVLTAGMSQGTATITVDIPDGTTLTGLMGQVHFGFPLTDVLTQARLDAQGFAADGSTPKRAVRTLNGVVNLIEKTLPDSTEPPGTRLEKRAVKRTRGVLNRLLKARTRAKGNLPDLGTDLEVASAVRQAAQRAIDRAVVVTGRHANRLSSAKTRLANGDEWRDAGKLRKAGTNYLRAFLKAFTLAPKDE
jgi:hypothetical protein